MKIMNNNPNLFFMVGLVGAGKSYYAEELAKNNNAIILSSDKLREELYDINDQTHNVEIFQELHKRVKDNLIKGIDVIYDATNINRKRRMAFIAELKNIPCNKICCFVIAPYEQCVSQNYARDRQVPLEVIERMYKNFNIPTIYEGFDEVRLVNNSIMFYGNWDSFYNKTKDISQDNPHHTLTIGDHCKKTFEYVAENFDRDMNLQYAAMFHDCGKHRVKSFVNSKGETTEIAHYYQHHTVSAYDSLFYIYDMANVIDKIYIALLIEYHMNPFLQWKDSSKAKEKDRKIFGSKFIEDIEKLHEADLHAH